MTNPWQEWKAKNLAEQEAGKVGPLSLINPDSPKVSRRRTAKRLKVCEGCPHLLVTKQCSQCGCFMPAKTKLLHATCPLGKW